MAQPYKLWIAGEEYSGSGELIPVEVSSSRPMASRLPSVLLSSSLLWRQARRQGRLRHLWVPERYLLTFYPLLL